MSKSMKSVIKGRVNHIYGKFVQVGRNFLKAKFVCSKRLLQRYASDSRFDSFRILGKSCVIFYSKEKRIKLSKPFLCGYTVLEKAKLFMYHTYYDRILPALDGPCRIVMSDTDSFLLHCFDTPKEEFMRRIKPISDFSNLHKSHPLYDTSNAGVPGFLKDELSGSDMVEAVALRAKQYTFKVRQVPYYIPGSKAEGVISPVVARCKGLSKAYTPKLKLQDFKDCFDDEGARTLSMETFHIRSQDFIISTQIKKSLALSCFDSKRFILRCAIHSVPFGSVYIKTHYDNCIICNK